MFNFFGWGPRLIIQDALFTVPIPKIEQVQVKLSFPARALRALGLLLADGAPHSGKGEDFLTGQLNFFMETAVTPEQKVEKLFPNSEINRHAEG